MAARINSLPGTADLTAPRIRLWQSLEQAARKVYPSFGYQEIRVPVIERTDLFVRSVGETTDIVEKEMFSFTTRGGDAVSLRPEGTAGVVRAFVQNGLAQSDPSARFWYLGPMYRYERPQKGRQR